MASVWGKFQQYVWKNWWLGQFSPAKGWDSEYQKPLLNGDYVVDFAAWHGNIRAVGDAKDKAILTADDVKKVIEDGGAFRATRLILIVAADTEIPESVRQYAEYNIVEIVRTRWRA